MCNTKYTEKDVLDKMDGRVIVFDNHWFIPKFIKFQYSTLFSAKPAVLSVAKELFLRSAVKVTGELLGNDYRIEEQSFDNHLRMIKDKVKDKVIDKGNDNTESNVLDMGGEKSEKPKYEPEWWRPAVSEFLKDTSFKSSFCKAKSIEYADLEKRMTDFVVQLNLKADYKDVAGLKSHFTNHYRKHVEKAAEGKEIKSNGFIEIDKNFNYDDPNVVTW